MTFEEMSELNKRLFVPESVWPLLACKHYPDVSYEEGLASQTNLSTPEISLYRPNDDEDANHFLYTEIYELVMDGVIDNLVPMENGSIGISVNDERALQEFVEAAQQAWEKCVDRLSINRIVETETTRYKIKSID